MARYKFTLLLTLLSLSFDYAAFARAEEVPTELLARYVDNDTLVIATARLKPELLAQLQALVDPQMITTVDREMMEKLKPILDSWGDRRVFVIAKPSDMVPGANGPLIIVTAAADENAVQFQMFAAKLRLQLLAGVKSEFAAQVRVIDTKSIVVDEEYRGSRYDANKPKLELVDTKVMLIASEAAHARFNAIKPQPRPDLTDPLLRLLHRESALAAVVAPGPDARRVLREMWPQLPPPYRAITGPLLADRVKQITFTAHAPPEWSAELAIHTSDEETAATLANTGKQVVEQFATLIQKELPMPGIDWSAMIETATPKQHGDTVSLTVSHDNPAIVKAVASLAATAVDDARKSAQRMQKMNQFKRIALAFHNYHDSQKAFPSTAPIRDKDGKPLLSWRVAILPYLGPAENLLFNEFHFDEPWDSKHNATLLDKMPDTYADPARPNERGNTTYLLPVHPRSAFVPSDDESAGKLSKSMLNGRELFIQPGFTYRNITDGTSVTIMVVETASDRAVPWTKPADWDVDLTNPIEGVKQEGRDGFVCARCDGSAHFVPFSINPIELRALLTRDGKEIIDWSDRQPRVEK